MNEDYKLEEISRSTMHVTLPTILTAPSNWVIGLMVPYYIINIKHDSLSLEPV